ncbi:helix-hairpin-helix domain-containing protein [Vicingus serpentipes]|uniref:Helix-hairpin-helix domain-containing protein n=1 Tax=Vicingus serpentipes TaxID=1926625 RepID=A0A5C6RRU4_9FLAO|nr:helix-hairpin-helix domain-containing protein [Vicingus serpentipes]
MKRFNFNIKCVEFSLHKCLLYFFLVGAFYSFGQTDVDQKNEIIEQRVEYLVDNAEESDVDYTTIFEQLSFFYDRPLNLNRAKLIELKELSLLTDFQINNLLSHIEENGKLMTLEELQTIDGFDKSTIQFILPFVKVTSNVDSPQLSFNELLNNGTNQLFVRYQQIIEEKKGFSDITDSALTASPNSRYFGNEARIFTRYKYNYGNYLSFGVTAEKDPGEDFFNGTQKNGFDFYSAHFFLKNQGKIKQLAIGDYQAQFGQGLTFWSGLAFGKSADIMSVKRSAIGLKPYTSVDENLFMRGAGLALKFDKIEVTTFYSRNKVDANIDYSDSTLVQDEVLSITSIQQTGFHRTVNELEDKDAITKQTIGGHLAFMTRKLNIGFTGVFNEINAQFNPNLQVYNQFRNTKSEQTNLGIDYNWIYKNFNFFGEFAQSIEAGKAIVAGALINLDTRLALSVLYRNYDRDFSPIASAGIGENSVNENEKGLYFGIVAKPLNKFTVSAYYDQFVFPWLKYQINAPSNGYQYLAQLTYKPSKKLEMYLRIKERRKGENTDIDLTEGIDYTVYRKQTNYRYNLSYQVSPSIKLKSRVELINSHLEETPTEVGYLIYQDVVYQSLKSPFSFSFRYGIFDTDSYNARIYAYENDVLYAFSIPAYYNRGTRTYLTVRYKIRRGLDVWLRYGLTYYDNVDVISSGLEEIQGNTKSEIKAQIRFKF